jgi:hypothetical protein
MTYSSASAPAKCDCALVGPRPNCSLWGATIALETSCSMQALADKREAAADKRERPADERERTADARDRTAD